MTGWLSVDPMADKYPGISPYAYCAWNPIILIDPNGCLIDDYFTIDGKYLGSDNANTHNIRIIPEHSWLILDKDENGVVTDETMVKMAHEFSLPFSDVSSKGQMTEEAQLKVYEHYNPTKITVANDATRKAPGMTTHFDEIDGKITIRLTVRLRANSKKDKNGWALCDNADEITNIFIHEKNHIDRARKMGYKAWRRLNNENPYDIERTAVEAQKNHPSWVRCSEKYQTSVNDYLNSKR